MLAAWHTALAPCPNAGWRCGVLLHPWRAFQAAFLRDDTDRTCFEFGDETGTDMNDFVWGDL